MDNKNNKLYLIYVIALLQGMIFYGPIATLYRQAQGISVFEITLIESISLVFMIILEVPWGFIADRIGYKKVIVICNILFFVSKIVFWKAESFAFFLIERLILSVVFSGLSGCDSAYIYILSGEKDSQKAFGIYGAMSMGGLIFASAIFSMIIKDNYELSAFLTVIAYSIAMILSFFIIDVKHEKNEVAKFSKQIKDIFCNFDKRFILFLLASTLLTESSQTITVFINQLQYLRSGIPSEYMGYIYIVVSISSLLSAYSYRFTEFIGETRAIKLLFCIAGLSCFFMAIFTNPLISILGVVFLRISSSLFAPISMNIQNRQIKITHRATMLSVYSSIMNIMAIVTNLIFGVMCDIDVIYAMGTGALFCAVGLIMYSIWVSKIQFRKSDKNN